MRASLRWRTQAEKDLDPEVLARGSTLELLNALWAGFRLSSRHRYSGQDGFHVFVYRAESSDAIGVSAINYRHLRAWARREDHSRTHRVANILQWSYVAESLPLMLGWLDVSRIEVMEALGRAVITDEGLDPASAQFLGAMSGQFGSVAVDRARWVAAQRP